VLVFVKILKLQTDTRKYQVYIINDMDELTLEKRNLH